MITKTAGKPLEVTFSVVNDWDSFDKLVTFVESHYSAKALTKADGPDARKWILVSNGIKFELVHDDVYGNYFLAPTEESEQLVLEITADLEQRLQNNK